MQFKHIGKAIALNSVLLKLNIMRNFEFKQSDLFLLWAVHRHSKEFGSTFEKVTLEFEKHHRTKSKTSLYKNFLLLSNEGFINEFGKNPKRYTLSISGSNVLNDYEILLKKSRV